MWVRSDVTSGRNRHWEWRPDAGDAEDGKTTSDASGRGARAADAGLIFANVTVVEMYSVGGIYIRTPPTPPDPSSFSSAPPPAIEISTPWEIIVRVSSASDLPRPWQLLGGLSRLHLLPLSGAFGLPSRGLWIPSWFRSSSFALMFLPFTPHFATRLA